MKLKKYTNFKYTSDALYLKAPIGWREHSYIYQMSAFLKSMK